MSFNPVAELNTAYWCETNPRQCPCRGSGWLLSDYDTWHRCAAHGAGVPHPEDEETEFDAKAHRMEMLRKAYEAFRESARQDGFKGHFRHEVEARAKSKDPGDLVDAAEALADEVGREAREVSARREGYSCDLERRWAEDAERERWEREHGF
jgi:hypothetical protein